MADRVHKSLMNVKVGLFFYFTSILLAFFSRRIFLENLGDQFIGLTGTLGSILNLLNISELGIGTCISFFLYKPIEQNDKFKICEIVSLFGWLYRIIGLFILGAGLVVSLFFPIIFEKEEISLIIIYFTFYCFLLSCIIGYLINYRQILLDSDQKTYKISIWTQSGSIIKTIFQLWLAYKYKNVYLWVSLEFIFSLFTCWILNYIISKEYPWLRTQKSEGRNLLKKYPDILIKAKQIFIHRMKNSLISKCDELFIFAFESLQMVTLYGNYNMVVGKLSSLFNNVFTGMNASIGNLVAEGDKITIKKVFWEFLFFRYWATGIIIICLSFLINPLIVWWVGEQYVLPMHIVALILLNTYILFTIPSVNLFINAYGLYNDTWAAYLEAFINISITVIIGWYWGLVGILLGKAISTIIMGGIWKPYYLYKYGFQDSIKTYWYNILTHIFILLSSIIMNSLLISVTGWIIKPTIMGFVSFLICISLPIIIVYSLLTAFFTSGAKDILSRISIFR